MASVIIYCSLESTVLPPKGIMWSDSDDYQKTLLSSREDESLKAKITAINSRFESASAYNNVWNNFRYDTFTLLYEPSIYSLNIMTRQESLFFTKYCQPCPLRHSMFCPGGTKVRCKRDIRVDTLNTRVTSPWPWLMATFEYQNIPERDEDLAEVDSYVRLHTPIQYNEDSIVGLTLFTGNTSTNGYLCLGDLSEDSFMRRYFAIRDRKEFDAGWFMANIMQRQFNKDYSVPYGDNKAWLENLAEYNVPEKVFHADSLLGPFGSITSFPAQKDTIFIAEPDEQLIGFWLLSDYTGVVKTTKRYWISKTNESRTHQDYAPPSN